MFALAGLEGVKRVDATFKEVNAVLKVSQQAVEQARLP